MKTYLLLFLTFLFYQTAQSQASGNYNFEQESGNYNAAARANMAVSSKRDTKLITSNPVTMYDDYVVFQINALYNQEAKNIVAVFNLTQIAPTAEEADRLLNERMNGFIAQITANGTVRRENVYVDMVSFLPRYEYETSKKLFSKKNYTEIPKGFELQKNVHIRYTQPDLLDDMVTAAAKNEIYELVKVDYIPDSTAQIYQDLRTRAVQYITNLATTYERLGVRLDSAQTFGESTWLTLPVSTYQSYEAFSSVSLDVLDKNATISRADKSKVHFYHPLTSENYDIVVHPDILEPVVQYSLQVQVRYRFSKPPVPPTPPTNKYLLVTPNGDVRELPVR